MGTISSAMSLISGALEADQAALGVVANNVANSSNHAYTREVPNWTENQPVYVNGVAYGSGVTVTGGLSQRDRVLEQRLQQQQQATASSTALLAALTTLQSNFTPASGTSASGNIGTDIASFFNSYAQLESNPTSNPLRQQVLATAATLAGDISSTATNMNSQQASLDQSAATVAIQVNAVTSSLAQVNQQIQSLSPGQDAGPLEDQRQSDLSQLSQLIGVNQISTEKNGLSVTTESGQILVSEAAAFPITTGTISGVTHFFVAGNDITAQLASGGGQLGGLITARDQSIPASMATLDNLACGVATQINIVNNAGSDLVGDNGNAGNIFNAPAQIAGSAVSMQVIMTNPGKIAAAGLGKGSGDNSNALIAASLATQAIISGQTPTNYYSNLVSTLGALVSQTTIQNTALNSSMTQLQSQRNSLSGVSLNEEASAMQQLQRSYQAASQVFSILNTIFAATLNLGVTTSVG